MKRGQFKRKKKIVFILSCIVTFLTVYSLVLPAITIDKETADEDNGIVLYDNHFINTEQQGEEADNTAETISSLENKTEVTIENRVSINEETEYPSVVFSDSINDTLVHVSAPEGAFPKGTVMTLKEVENEEVSASVGEVINNNEIISYKAIDITFVYNGEKIEPRIPIEVSMTSNFISEDSKDPLLVHIDDEGKTDVLKAKKPEEDLVETISENSVIKELIENNNDIDEITTDNTLTFESDSFSVYVLVYTVHFEYEVNGETFDTEIPGGQNILLSDVLGGLNIVEEDQFNEFITRIADVKASDPEVLIVSSAEHDWTIRPVRNSEKPESLTVFMQDGSSFTVKIETNGVTQVVSDDDTVTISTVNDLYLPEESKAYVELYSDTDSKEIAATIPEIQNIENSYQAFSVDLKNVDLEEYEGFRVEVVLPEDSVVGKDFQLYQIKDDESTDLTDTLELNAEQNNTGLDSVSSFSFETNEFAEYVLSYSIETYYRSYTGDTFKIELKYGPEAEIPSGSVLEVREILAGTEEFSNYLQSSSQRLGLSIDEVSFARFFDIELNKDGKKIEPNAPVVVTISYVDKIILEDNNSLDIVHFADNDTEVIDASLNEEDNSISYIQNSFSVTGTIISGSPDDNQKYAVIVKNGDNYYAVQSDGSLLEVEYSLETNVATVKMEYPLLWTYSSENVTSGTTGGYSGPVTNLRIPTLASGFTGQNLPSGYYFRYIDPNSDAGIREEEHQPGFTDEDKAAADRAHPKYVWDCAVRYENNKVKGHNNYIGVDANTMHIKGNVPLNEAAEVYLAKVTSVPPSANVNHTVNHIDISIEGGATYTQPLAYGDYYYYVDGEKRTLSVNPDNNVTLELKIDSVPITPEDMKHAEVTAFSNKSGILNDAFYITGYSQNKENSISTPQVRIEGSFKVADLEPYENTNEDNLTAEQLANRLENRIYYTVTAKKDLTFNWEYEYASGQKAQLYNANNEPLSKTVKVNLSKSFDYWDEDNECPPIKEVNPSLEIPKWKEGHIIWDTSAGNGSGMDFKLEANASASGQVAIEITKTLLTDSGEILHPKNNVTNLFVVHQKVPATPEDYNDVADIGTGENSKAPNYNGYSGIHAKSIVVGDTGEGLVYDYDVSEGMVYVSEDENSISNTIIDTEGHKWKYVKTYVETKYAWRNYGDENKIHYVDGLNSIPEVLGNYGEYYNTEKGQIDPLFNQFQEFDFYNVYEREDEIVTLPVTKTWSDFAGAEYSWNAVFQLQYIEKKIRGDGPDQSVREWTNYVPENVLTMHKDAHYQESVSSTFGDLPKYRRDENGNVYERQYSAEELRFEVSKNGQMLYSFDGTNYTFGDGADQTLIYKAFYDHDANENYDGDWNLRISNSAAQKIEPKHIDIGIHKIWTPNIPNGASAKFVLKRYVQTEYADYSETVANPTVTVNLVDSNGRVLDSILTRSGMNVYIDAIFAPEKTGTFSFKNGGETYTISNTVSSDVKVNKRSNPIPIVGQDGDVINVQLTSGDLSNLLEGSTYNIRITDRLAGTDPVPDTSFSREIQFPVSGMSGNEAWQYIFEDLTKEEGEWNADGTLANFNIYSYYLEETSISPEDDYRIWVRDPENNTVSESNRINDGYTVIANNIHIGEHIRIEKRWYRLVANQMPPVVIKVTQTINNVTSNVTQDAYDLNGNIVKYSEKYGGYILDKYNGWAIDLNELEGNVRRDFAEIGFIDGGNPSDGYASGHLIAIPTGGTGYDSKHYYFSSDGTAPNETEHDALVGQITTNGGGNIYATSGTMFVYNVPNYVGYQVEVHKKWYSFNGTTGMSDITDHYGAEEGTGFIMQLQQRARWNGTDTVASDWSDYGKPFEIYIDRNTANVNGFEQVMQGQWLTTVDEKNLSRYGYLFNADKNDYETVEYDYRFVEVGVIEGNDGRIWSKSIASTSDPEQGGDHRYRIENFEVGKIELQKYWNLNDSKKKASEVYFKIYSDWWFSSYNAQPTQDGLYDVADIIGRDINDPSLSSEEKALTEAYWLSNGVTVKQVGDLGYVFALSGTSDQWTGGIVKGLPLLKADPNIAGDAANNSYGEVSYTVAEVGAWHNGLVKVGTSSWPYVDPLYYRNTRNQGDNRVENGETFQIDNGTVDYASYFRAINSDIPTWKFHTEKTWEKLPQQGSDIVLELQTLRLTSDILALLTPTEEQIADGIKVSNLTEEQVKMLVALESGWSTAEIENPSVVLPKNWDYVSMPEDTEEQRNIKEEAATKAWSVDWSGLPMTWSNDSVENPEEYELLYRVVETSNTAWTTYTIGDLTIGVNDTLSQNIVNKGKEDKTGELTIEKVWKKDGDVLEWPDGYVINYKVIQHAYLAEVTEASNQESGTEGAAENANATHNLIYKANTSKPVFEIDFNTYTSTYGENQDAENGKITNDQNPVTLHNLPKGALWTAPSNEDEITAEMIAAGIQAGKTYSIAYGYEVVETSVSKDDNTLPFAASSGSIDVNTTSNGTLLNEVTEVIIKKQWKKNGQAIEQWPEGYTVGYRVIQEAYIDGNKVGEDISFVSTTETALNKNIPTATVSMLPINGVWTAKVPGESDPWKSSYDAMELNAGEEYKVSFRYRVEEATETSEGSTKPIGSNYSFEAIKAVFDEQTKAYVITNDLTEIKVVKVWEGYAPQNDDKVGVKLYVSTTAPGDTEKINLTTQVTWTNGTVAPETFSIPLTITGIDSKGNTVETRNLVLSQNGASLITSLEKHDDYDELITYTVSLNGEPTGDVADVAIIDPSSITGEDGTVTISAKGVIPQNTGSITIENVDFDGTISVAETSAGENPKGDWSGTNVIKGNSITLSGLKPGAEYFIKLNGFSNIDGNTNPISSFPNNVRSQNWNDSQGYWITATAEDTRIVLTSLPKRNVPVTVTWDDDIPTGSTITIRTNNEEKVLTKAEGSQISSAVFENLYTSRVYNVTYSASEGVEVKNQVAQITSDIQSISLIASKQKLSSVTVRIVAIDGNASWWYFGLQKLHDSNWSYQTDWTPNSFSNNDNNRASTLTGIPNGTYYVSTNCGYDGGNTYSISATGGDVNKNNNDWTIVVNDQDIVINVSLGNGSLPINLSNRNLMFNLRSVLKIDRITSLSEKKASLNYDGQIDTRTVDVPDSPMPSQNATVIGRAGLPHGAVCLTETEIELSKETDPTTEEAWSHLWKDLPKTDADGNTLYYYIVETSATVGGTTVKASYERTEATENDPEIITITNEVEKDQKFGSLKVTKELSGVTTDSHWDKPFMFTLQNSDKKYLNATSYEWQDNSVGAKFEITPKTAIQFNHLLVGNYYVTETSTGEELNITAYEYDALHSVKDSGEEGIQVSESNTEDSPATFALKNVYIPKTTAVSVTKAWQNADGKTNPPSDATVTFDLYRNDTKLEDASIVLNGQADESGEAEAWVASWTNLPAYDENESPYSYTVKESLTDGKYGWMQYIVSYPKTGETVKEYAVNGETITNIEESIDFTVDKKWFANESDAAAGSPEKEPDQKTIYYKIMQKVGNQDAVVYQYGESSIQVLKYDSTKKDWTQVKHDNLPVKVYDTVEKEWEDASYYVIECDALGNPISQSNYTVTYQKNNGTAGEASEAIINRNDAERVITIINTDALVPIRIFKVDAEDNTNLSAKFKLYKKNDTGVYVQCEVTGKTDSNGEFTVAKESGIEMDLLSGEYKIEEISSPAGYIISEDSTFYFKVVNGSVIYTDSDGHEITDSSDLLVKYTKADSQPSTFTVGNRRGVELPHTGGSGTLRYTVLGSILVLASLVAFTLSMRKESER